MSGMNVVSVSKIPSLLRNLSNFCSVSVVETQEHPKGYTVYKICLHVAPRDSLSNDTVKYVIWRRYSDLRVLYQKLFLTFHQLHLRGKFPDFARPQVFGRHQAAVVRERVFTAELFLNFALQHSVLRCNPYIAQFFEDAKLDESAEGSLVDQVGIEPVVLWSDKRDSVCSLDADVTTDASTVPLEPQSCSSSTGLVSSDKLTMLHAELDSVSLGRSEGGCSTPETDLTYTRTDSFLSPDELNFFDPFASVPSASSGTTCGHSDALTSATNEWLLSSVDQLHSSAQKDDVDVVQTPKPVKEEVPVKANVCRQGSPELTKSRRKSSLLRASAKSTADLTVIGAQEEKTQRSSKIAMFFPKLVQASKSEAAVQPQAAQLIIENALKPVRSEGNVQSFFRRMRSKDAEQPSGKIASPLSRSPRKTAPHDLPADDYLYQAAQFISSAQKSEAEGHYDLAFSCYKAGVNMLIRGVQGEEDVERRNAVRKKTARYLLKAERLYRAHLAFDEAESEKSLWRVDPLEYHIQNPELLGLHGSLSELKKFKIVGAPANNVMLVHDENDHEYVLKFLSKTTYPEFVKIRQTMVPVHVPFMVKLIRYFETNNSIILLLQHAAHGALWRHLAGYFRARRTQHSAAVYGAGNTDTDGAAVADPMVEQSVQASRSVLFSVSSDVQLPGDANVEPSRDRADTGGAFSEYMYRAELQKKASGSSFDSLSLDVPAAHHSGSPSPCFVSPNADQKFESVVDGMKASLRSFVIASIDEEDIHDHDIRGDTCLPVAVDQAEKTISGPPGACSVTGENENLTVRPSSSGSGLPVFSPVLNSKATPVPQSGHSPAGLDFSRTLNKDYGQDVWLKELEHSMSTGSLRSCIHLPYAFLQLWAAQLVLAVSHLHNEAIICRNIKPSDLLLNEKGHLLLAYRCFWNCVDCFTEHDAVQQLYIAPEVDRVDAEPATTADWWTVGSILYELLLGIPLYCFHAQGITAHTSLICPGDLPVATKDLLEKLLTVPTHERLGSGQTGVEEIKSHAFFAGIDWDALLLL